FSFSQVSYTAQDTVVSYNSPFGYGTNAGYFPPHNNVQVSSLAAGDPALSLTGAGCRSIRGAVPHDFITTWGLTADMNYWTHNTALGLNDNVAFIGFPHSSVEDPHLSCGGVTCPVHNLPHKPGNFSGLYLPVWDGGANGTPVNESNTYAKYVYDIVTTYKNHVRFWEIWNEPDFSFSPNAYAPPSDPNSWWNRSNFECDCPCMAGDIFNYVRLLRVSYEVIKTVDSTAYICTGGLGYSSFLDAVLRYTDNPVDGSVTTAYPATGGAYFDVLSFHVYPQYSSQIRSWSSTLNRTVYHRHSDGAANGTRGKQQEMMAVLASRGYDGGLYPEKEWILTEHNISRRQFGNFVGGEEAQRNYMLKTLVMQQLDGVRQSYVYGISEKKTVANAGGTFDLMGMYEALTNRPLNQPLNESGVANKTISQILYGATIDTTRTQALALPANVGGGAFLHASGNYTYALWAVTQTDRSEQASATFSLPSSLVQGQLEKREWNYSQTGTSTFVLPSSISLNGTPAFFTEQGTLPVELVSLDANVLSDGDVSIVWETASEHQNDYFTVLRSTDNVAYQKLQQVPGEMGNGFRRYEVKDRDPLAGQSWYRLQQTDIDGSMVILGTVAVEINKPSALLLLTKTLLIKGEPMEIKLGKPTGKEARLSLLGMDGKSYARIKIETTDNYLTIPTQVLTPGLYTLLLQTNEDQKAIKVQILPQD
ncbi:MAG: hypothetical protein AB8F95_22815, partial [Bacteroidia bacterium]